MADNVEKVKEALSIEEVVSLYAQLKPAGTNLKARCPFHNEKTPSFVVSPARGTYHCFGCGVGGDMFSFVQAIEGVDFKGALVMLAERAGVQLEFTKGAAKDDKDVLFDIAEAATAFYETALEKNTEALAYLEKRGLTSDTIKSFRLGFAPDEWEALHTHLQQQQYKSADIERAGLIKKSEKGKGYYDRFRSRIMFPIADSVGRVVGFSGRIFGKDTDPSNSSGQAAAKYINSPETPLYNKSNILFGFDRAKQPIRRNNFSILVEGQMDLLLSHQVGYSNTIALSGTALTAKQVTDIGRMSKNMVIALDADTAGIAAAGKSAHAALLAGFDVKVMALPDGKDPADVIHEEGKDAWRERIKNAEHVIPFFLQYVRTHTKDERSFRLQASKQVLPFVHDIQSPVDKAYFIGVVARALGVDDSVVVAELQTVKKEGLDTVASPVKKESAATPQRTPLEHAVLLLCWRQSVTRNDSALKEFREALIETFGNVQVEALTQKYTTHTNEFFALESTYGERDIADALVEARIRATRFELSERVARAGVALRKAEAAKDATAIQKALEASEEARKALVQFQSTLPDEW